MTSTLPIIRMKLNKIYFRLCIPSLATCCLLACSEKPAEKDEIKGEVEYTTDIVVSCPPSQSDVKNVSNIITNGYEWKDQKLRDGRLVKLFAAPGFPADSAHHYSIKENGRPYIIRVSQYGKSWIGNVLDNTEGEEKSFESITAPSLDDCLELIRNQHGFTGKIKKLLMD